MKGKRMKKAVFCIRLALCIIIVISFLYTTLYFQNIRTELIKKDNEIQLLKINTDQLYDRIEDLNKRVEEAEILLKNASSLQ